MGELTAVRWRRYGMDRLYVNAADGTRVGWLDLATGETHLELAELRDDFEAAVATQRPSRHDESVPDEKHRNAAPEEGWQDLATNLPGQAPRERALELKREAPVHTLLARLLRVDTEERHWRIGADGEEMVAQQLDQLSPEWRVLHSVPVGSGSADIDHIVIGAGGVYTINAKHLPHAAVWVAGDTFLVNGVRQAYVYKSRSEARRASRRLTEAVGSPIEVTGVIAVVGARGGFMVKEQPQDVRVVPRRDLTSWLENRNATLTSELAELVYAAARRSSTWT